MPPGKAPRALQYVRARVEPKTFFANERTFLQVLRGEGCSHQPHPLSAHSSKAWQ